jgi:hypothetical protein
MPHLGSNTIRALYDVSVGGKPTAYQCQVELLPNEPYRNSHDKCHKVTRTYRGMVMHQRLKHGIEQQGSFDFGEIKATIWS